MADHAPVSRPLSPHLQVWRWHWTMASSILHRATGVGNAVGALVITWWLASAALGPGAYGVFEGLALSWFGQLVLFGFTVSISYHFANGIRHLVWDVGKGYGPGIANAVSVFNIGFAIGFSVGIWVVLGLTGFPVFFLPVSILGA